MWSRARAAWVVCALGLVGVLGCGPAPPDNLVFLSLDTVRQDHLSTYGYSRETSPRIDALAERAVVFDNAFAQQTNTNPSHASMFTGLYPHVHGSTFNGQRLAPERITLAQILRRAGFRTAGFVSGITMRRVTAGLDRGFERYNDAFRGKRRDGLVATRLAVRWLRERRPDERFFLFVHFYDAHGPYLPKPKYARLFTSPEGGPRLESIPPYQQLRDGAGDPLLALNDYVDRYDATIRYQDDLVASLLDELDLSRTVVVILSDHGETLGERFRPLDHGARAFDEQLRIPLILWAPGLPQVRISEYVETVDLLPTFLELLGVPLPKGLPLQGRSLLPLVRGEVTELHPVVFAQARAESSRNADRGYELRRRSLISTVRGPRWKLILYPGVRRDYLELYDLERDPGERENRADSEPEIRDVYLRILQEWLRQGTGVAPATPLPPEVQEQLRELGYVD